MTDKLSKAEIRKDAVQEGFTAATHTVGTVATIVIGAVGDIGRAMGGFATELFEIRDSARRAGRDHWDDDLDATVVDATTIDEPDQPNDI
jgi:hypothetical protein